MLFFLQTDDYVYVTGQASFLVELPRIRAIKLMA